jgi:hypothetical protein
MGAVHGVTNTLNHGWPTSTHCRGHIIRKEQPEGRNCVDNMAMGWGKELIRTALFTKRDIFIAVY